MQRRWVFVLLDVLCLLVGKSCGARVWGPPPGRTRPAPRRFSDREAARPSPSAGPGGRTSLQHRAARTCQASGSLRLGPGGDWGSSACPLTCYLSFSRLSFYSGHASFGMYCMVFLALYVQARLCWKWARLLRPTVQFFLVAFALYVGYTRVSDHKHHWSDVLAGLLQGALVAGLTVRYVSDFFKARPPQHCPKEEELERKPSLSLTVTLGEADHNHYGYPHSSS
uniref:Phosphatidic acid phosphatase type 2/haloperoxidase domain-containing protein n=1 Tax=Saimiri boliviensis boliviensis TaxID=39432 RepID=A0A2K6SJ53_SAIBB